VDLHSIKRATNSSILFLFHLNFYKGYEELDLILGVGFRITIGHGEFGLQ